MSLNVRDVDLTGGTGGGGGRKEGGRGTIPLISVPNSTSYFELQNSLNHRVLLNFIKVNLRNVCFRWLCADLSLKLFWRFAVEG